MDYPGFSRRDFLNTTLLGASALALTGVTGCAHMGGTSDKIPVGLQLYSIRNECKDNLAGCIAEVGRMGYKGVEFAGYHGHSAMDIRKMMDDSGVVCCGTHTPYESILSDKLRETIEFNRTLGNKYLIVPWMEGKTRQEWLDKARLFNEVAEKVKPEGMVVGYHAHAHDFHLFEGVSAWDLFFGNTKPEVVMQLDTSNCIEGGADPVVVLKKYPARATTIHLKANGNGKEAVIGEDNVNWKEVFAFCEGPGRTKWYIVEHESGSKPMESVRRSIEALKQMGKA